MHNQDNNRENEFRPCIYPVPRGPSVTDNSLMVQLKEGVDTKGLIAEFEQKYGASFKELCPNSKITRDLYQVQMKPEDLQNVLADLNTRSEVQFAERENIFYPMNSGPFDDLNPPKLL